MDKNNLTQKQQHYISQMNERYKGKKYNLLTFVEHSCKWAGPKPGKNPIGIWLCDCGQTKEVRFGDVVSGKTTCCGCETGRDGGKAQIGTKWGNLTLIETLGKKHNQNYGKFKCDCGNTVNRKLGDVNFAKHPSCGCLISEQLRHARGFTLNESVFENITDDSAYWLGFLLADGNVSKNTICINLKTSDTPHLEKFRDFVGGNQKISVSKDPRVSRYSFGSIKMVKDLAKWWIIPAKSYVAKVHPELENNRHFWRGMIDGDGHISLSHSAIGLCGTFDVCESFRKFAVTKINSKAIVTKAKDNLWHIRFGCGRPDSAQLLKTIYHNCETYLDRKYISANTLIERSDLGQGEHVEYNGIKYRSKREACDHLNVSFDKLLKILDGRKLESERIVSVRYKGIIYRTKTEARKALNLNLYAQNKLISIGEMEIL